VSWSYDVPSPSSIGLRLIWSTTNKVFSINLLPDGCSARLKSWNRIADGPVTASYSRERHPEEKSAGEHRIQWGLELRVGYPCSVPLLGPRRAFAKRTFA
jgi:hypothetical protein